MSDNVADTVRKIQEDVRRRGGMMRPAGVMVDYDDLERYFYVLANQLAPTLRDGRVVTITPNSPVGRSIVHLTRDEEAST